MSGKLKTTQNINGQNRLNYKESETDRNTSTTANELVESSILRCIVKTLIVWLGKSKWAKPWSLIDRKHEQYLNEAVILAAIIKNRPYTIW